MSSRSYLSIGDVLALLRQEFPDVTISKIRFLESQGLVNPERTPSGYRKFYEHDVERLRWVLRQQREHFLPLKVIKGRLEHEGSDGEADAVDGQVDRAQAARRPEPVLVGRGAGASRSGRDVSGREPTTGRPPSASAVARAPASSTRAGTGGGPGTRSESPSGAARSAGAGASRAPTALKPPGGAAKGASASAPGKGTALDLESGVDPGEVVRTLSGTSMTVDEVAAGSGLDVVSVAELESYGLLCGRVVGGVAYYDEDALVVARLAAGLARYGVEARHLRLHKHAAEREAGFIEQIVLPLLKQRNPDARQRALDAVAELTLLGQGMREVLLRTALRDQLGG